MIKHQIYSILAMATLIFAAMACEENEDYLAFEEANTNITIEGYPAYAAEFSLLDQVVLPVKAPGAQEIQVIRDVTYTPEGADNEVEISETLATLSGPEATLTSSIAAITANPANLPPSALSSVALLFQVNVNGQTSFRRFDLEFFDPLTVEAPKEAFNDSTILVKYALANENATISNVSVFLRDTTKGEFSTTPLQTFTGAEDSLEVVIPAEAVVAPGGDIGLKVVATGADGQTVQKTVSVSVPSIPLGEAMSAVLAANGPAFDFSAGDTTSTAGDLQLLVRDGGLLGGTELVLEGVGGSEFVVAEEGFGFEDATFQTIRDAYGAGTAFTSLGDVRDLPTGLVLIMRLADATTGSVGEYAVVRLDDVVVGFDLAESEVAIQYRVP